MFCVLHQLVDAVSPVQARLPTFSGQRHLPPTLYDDRALEARGAGVSERPRSEPSCPRRRQLTDRALLQQVPTRPQRQHSGVSNPTTGKNSVTRSRPLPDRGRGWSRAPGRRCPPHAVAPVAPGLPLSAAVQRPLAELGREHRQRRQPCFRARRAGGGARRRAAGKAPTEKAPTGCPWRAWGGASGSWLSGGDGRRRRAGAHRGAAAARREIWVNAPRFSLFLTPFYLFSGEGRQQFLLDSGMSVRWTDGKDTLSPWWLHFRMQRWFSSSSWGRFQIWHSKITGYCGKRDTALTFPSLNLPKMVEGWNPLENYANPRRSLTLKIQCGIYRTILNHEGATQKGNC